MQRPNYHAERHHEVASKFFGQKFFRLEIHQASKPSGRPYSILTSAALSIGHHFAISDFWKAPSASGVS
jgi:hypothetical protein